MPRYGHRKPNTEYPTETTVFQLAATTPETRRYWESYQSDGQTYIDPNGVGYYLSRIHILNRTEEG